MADEYKPSVWKFLTTGKTKKMSGAGPRRDDKLRKAEEKALGIKPKPKKKST